MSAIILVDFNSLLKNPDVVKQKAISGVVNTPEALITVLNANEGADADGTELLLRILRFPHDNVVCNPLNIGSPPIVFKSMFAERIVDQQIHEVVMVLDDDFTSQQMWEDTGVLHHE